MAQDFPNVAATDYISASRQNLLDRDAALRSNFSGSSYPTVDVIVGQTCWRTDLQKMYVLESASPDVWREIVKSTNLGTAAFAAVDTSGDALGKLNVTNTWSARQNLTSGIEVASAAISGTSGELKADTDLRLNAYSGKDMNFLINSASKMKLYADGGVTVGAPTGNSKGNGTFNAQSIYLNGTILGSAATKNTGTSTGAIPLYENFGALAFLGSVDTAQLTDNAVSLAKLAHLTAGSLISFNPTGNTPQLILPGDAGTVLTSNGTNQMPTWQQGSGLVKLDAVDATGTPAASVGFSLDWANYYDFQIRYRGVRVDVSSNNAKGELLMKPSVNGGSSFVPAARMLSKVEDVDLTSTGGASVARENGAYTRLTDGNIPGDQYTYTNVSGYPAGHGFLNLRCDGGFFMCDFDTTSMVPTANYAATAYRRTGTAAISATNSTTSADIGVVNFVQLYGETSLGAALSLYGYFELWGRRRT